MANKILSKRACKIQLSGVTTAWHFIFELCRAADSPTDESMQPDAGDNKIWFTQKPDVVKSDGNVAVLSDIVVKDGVTVLAPTAFDPLSGKVTLASTPAATPTATYKYVDKARHQGVMIQDDASAEPPTTELTDMTDKEDENEAQTLAIAKAITLRTAWLAALVSAPTQELHPAVEGNVTL